MIPTQFCLLLTERLALLQTLSGIRGLGYPLERPKSVTTAMLEEAAGIK